LAFLLSENKEVTYGLSSGTELGRISYISISKFLVYVEHTAYLLLRINLLHSFLAEKVCESLISAIYFVSSVTSK